MVRWMTSAAALAMALSLMGPAVAKSAKKVAAPTCPACKMTLSTKKTKANPRMVKIGGKTYYCCAACDMSKKAGTSKGAAVKKAS
jgi:YHS domain-containing protein